MKWARRTIPASDADAALRLLRADIGARSSRASGATITVAAAALQATVEDLANSSIEPVSRTHESVQSLLDAVEPGVAYEILCDNLYEDDIQAPEHLLVQLQREAVAAGMDGGRVAALLS